LYARRSSKNILPGSIRCCLIRPTSIQWQHRRTPLAPPPPDATERDMTGNQ
jgi:hypothetical protein